MKRKLNLLPFALSLLMAITGALSALAADITASGTVFDSTGDPLIGVSAGVKGKHGLGTATDIDGTFSIKVPEGSTLVFSYIGCVTRELKAASGVAVQQLTPFGDKLQLYLVVPLGQWAKLLIV